MRIAVLACLVAGCITTPNFSVDKTGDGMGRVTSDVGGINCGEVCGGLVEGPITLTASPAHGSLFAGWSGADQCGSDPTCEMLVTEDTTIEAKFDRFYPTLTVIPSEHGTVNARGIDCGTDCNESYDFGTFVTLTATPLPSWTLVGWTGVPCTPPGACTVTMTESLVAEPLFGQPSTLQAGSEGLGGHAFTATFVTQ